MKKAKRNYSTILATNIWQLRNGDVWRAMIAFSQSGSMICVGYLRLG